MPGERLLLDGIDKSYQGVTALHPITVDVAAGEFLTLLGPSGSGKTTTLKITAGFESPDDGRVWLGNSEITRLPPYERDIGMVFQNYALFPHLSVADNIGFPLEMRGRPKAEIRARVAEALQTVRLPQLGERKPRALSGGQQQRVALARALVFRPRLLLMDEPLGALDRSLREAMQLEIVRITRSLGITTLYVTHDQEEALAMSHRIAVYRAGAIEQIGTPETIFNCPRSLFVARFLGESSVVVGTLARCGEQWRLDAPAGLLPVDATTVAVAGLAEGAVAALVVRPEAVRLGGDGAEETGWTARLRGRVESSIFLGTSRKHEIVLTDGTTMIVRSPVVGEEPPPAGREVEIWWRPQDAFVLPADPAEC